MKTTLRIDRLVLRTRGLTSSEAQAAAKLIVPALAEGLAGPSASGAIPHVQVTLPASAARAPAEIARHVARAISSTPRS
jgi:hypothetical protein